MNIHVSEDIRKKYPNMEFVGVPRVLANRTVIKAVNHSINTTYYYSFDEDFFWFADAEMPIWFIKNK